MTKSDRIRDLYAEGKSTREIADIVGCGTPYVRVCARQRVPGGHDPNKDYQRRMWAFAKEAGDRMQARVARNRAYRAARDRGLDIDQAHGIAGGAYGKTLIETARRSIRPIS